LGKVSYLLDTHALLWWLFDDRRLSRQARGIIRDPENRLCVSSASAWEIATKHRLGKLASAAPLVSDFGGFMVKAGFSELTIRWAHAVRAGTWDVEHRDPFDRMLAAQAALDGLTLITADPAFVDFGIPAVW
jgi:PIN domain nuclease of toxin-antitoxin system